MAAQKPRSPKGLWLHAYGIRPPQPRKLLRRIAALLRAENRRARQAGRAWSGALFSDTSRGPVTHVVLVSDSDRRDEGIQLSLEAELKKLDADIVIPMPVRVPGRQESKRSASRNRLTRDGTSPKPRAGYH